MAAGVPPNGNGVPSLNADGRTPNNVGHQPALPAQPVAAGGWGRFRALTTLFTGGEQPAAPLARRVTVAAPANTDVVEDPEWEQIRSEWVTDFNQDELLSANAERVAVRRVVVNHPKWKAQAAEVQRGMDAATRKPVEDARKARAIPQDKRIITTADEEEQRLWQLVTAAEKKGTSLGRIRIRRLRAEEATHKLHRLLIEDKIAQITTELQIIKAHRQGGTAKKILSLQEEQAQLKGQLERVTHIADAKTQERQGAEEAADAEDGVAEAKATVTKSTTEATAAAARIQAEARAAEQAAREAQATREAFPGECAELLGLLGQHRTACWQREEPIQRSAGEAECFFKSNLEAVTAQKQRIASHASREIDQVFENLSRLEREIQSASSCSAEEMMSGYSASCKKAQIRIDRAQAAVKAIMDNCTRIEQLHAVLLEANVQDQQGLLPREHIATLGCDAERDRQEKYKELKILLQGQRQEYQACQAIVKVALEKAEQAIAKRKTDVERATGSYMSISALLEPYVGALDACAKSKQAHVEAAESHSSTSAQLPPLQARLEAAHEQEKVLSAEILQLNQLLADKKLDKATRQRLEASLKEVQPLLSDAQEAIKNLQLEKQGHENANAICLLAEQDAAQQVRQAESRVQQARGALQGALAAAPTS